MAQRRAATPSNRAARASSLPFRPPMRGFIPYIVALALLTYVAVSAEIAIHSAKGGLLGRFMNREPLYLAILLFIPRLINRFGFMHVANIVTAVFGGIRVLQCVVKSVWIAHILEAAATLYVSHIHNLDHTTTARYAINTFLGGFTQLIPMVRAHLQSIKHRA